LVVATFVAYQSAWRAGFIWDDDEHLTANPAMTAPNGLQMIWSSLTISRYYPLTLTSFWVQRRLWGLNPMPYHLVNIALHAINGVLVFLLLRRLRVPGAWLAAFLWALHPVNVESVAWITEMKNTQSGLFFFMAILCFLRFAAHKKPLWYALALLCGLAALLSKPSTVVLPLVLLLCVWWEQGRWQRADIARIVPFFGLAFGMSALTVIEQRGHILRASLPEWKLTVADRLVVAGKAVWFYAAKLLWPVDLTFVYPHWDLETKSFLSWLPLAGVIAGGAVLWVWRRRPWARVGLFGLGCFVAGLLPVLGFFDVFYFLYSFVADHFQYLASVAFIALVAGVATRICEGGGRVGRHIGTVTGAATLIVLGALTWTQGSVYRNFETLWRDTLAKNPDCWMAHNNLGDVLHKAGDVQEAIGHYEQALRLKPDYAEVHYNLGNVLNESGRNAEAIGHYQQALRIRPRYAEAQNNWGNALRQMGRPADAIAHYEQALRLKPDYAEVHFNLGNVLHQAGRNEEAITHYEQALRINPNLTAAHYNLGNALFQAGRSEDAIRHYEQVLRNNPDLAAVHYNLGNVFFQTGKLEDAIRHYKEALRIDPGDADVWFNLGLVLTQAGRTQEAVRSYEQAVRLKPDFSDAQKALARLRTVQ
jgi:tetratricopeptide (TPR) repeat protein